MNELLGEIGSGRHGDRLLFSCDGCFGSWCCGDVSQRIVRRRAKQELVDFFVLCLVAGSAHCTEEKKVPSKQFVERHRSFVDGAPLVADAVGLQRKSYAHYSLLCQS